MGIRVPFEELKADSFVSALTCLVRDGTYADSLQQAQFSFRSRQVKPLDEAVWYIEQLASDPELFKHLQHPRSRENAYFVSHSFDVLIWPLLFIIAIIFVLMTKNVKKMTEKVVPVEKEMVKVEEEEENKPKEIDSELFEKIGMEEKEYKADEDKKQE